MVLAQEYSSVLILTLDSFSDPQFIPLLNYILLQHSLGTENFSFPFLEDFLQFSLSNGDLVVIFLWNDPRTTQNLVFTLRNVCPGKAQLLVCIFFFTWFQNKDFRRHLWTLVVQYLIFMHLKSIFLTNWFLKGYKFSQVENTNYGSCVEWWL